MRFLLALAWKNLSRYRRRTIITAAAIAFGLVVYVFMDSLLLGLDQESERNLIRYESSSARVMHPDYWEERLQRPIKYVIDEPEPIIRRLAEQGYPATPRVVFAAELIVRRDPYPEDGSMQVSVSAVDPTRDEDVFGMKETIEAGRYLEPGEDGVVMGSWLAEDLGAEIGYTLTLVTRTRDGYRQAIDAEIVGIFNCPNPYVNRSTLLMPLDTADFHLEMRGAATEIDMRLPERRDPLALARVIEEDLNDRFGGVAVMGWPDLAADYVALAESKKSSSGMVLFLVFIVAAVGVSNTMLMSVFERVRELGTMRAMGMLDRQIRWLFVMEAAGIGFLGAAAGTALGAAVNVLLVNVGIDYSSILRQADMGYRVSGFIRGAWNPQGMAGGFIAAVLVCSLVALVPTRRALKMRVTECLRTD